MKLNFLLAIAFVSISISAAGRELVVIKSDNLKCNDSILVYTPKSFADGAKECCGEDESIPTLILLHGFSGCYRNWSDKSDLQAFSDKYGFRIICPDGFYNSWYADAADPEGMQWRSFYDKEFFPAMKERYNLEPERTFVSGLSMGGMGAINLFIDHPDWYAAAGSMSGVLNLHRTNLIEKWVTKVLGPYGEDKSLYDANSPLHRIDKLAGCSKPLVITCGYDDYYSICTEEFNSKCKEMGLKRFFMLTPATHSWKYWDFALDIHLMLFSKIVNGENLGF